MRVLVFLSCAFLFNVSNAQDLIVTSFEAASVQTPRTVVVTKIYDDSGKVIAETNSDPTDGQPVETPIPMVRVETEATVVTVAADDIDRNPVKVNDVGKNGLYSIEGTGRVWVRVKAVDFDRKIFREKTIVVLASTPEPDDPDNPGGSSLEDLVFTETSNLKADNKTAVSGTIAKVYRSVAGRAAGLSAMNHKGMLDEIRKQLDRKLQVDQRQQWASWAISVAEILGRQNLGTDKSKHIQAFLEIARGLERFNRTAPKAQPPLPAPVQPVLP